MNLKVAILITFFSALSLGVFAQNNTASHKINVSVPEVALLGLVSDNQRDVVVSANAPNEAGSSVEFSKIKNSGVWINYSSVVSEASPRRKVIAMIQGEIPSWVNLSVEASEYRGSGKGRLGKSAGTVRLSNQATDVIVDIGSCYTGKGVNNGHYLSYDLNGDLSSEDYAALSEMQASVNVVYTLTDYN